MHDDQSDATAAQRTHDTHSDAMPHGNASTNDSPDGDPPKSEEQRSRDFLDSLEDQSHVSSDVDNNERRPDAHDPGAGDGPGGDDHGGGGGDGNGGDENNDATGEPRQNLPATIVGWEIVESRTFGITPGAPAAPAVYDPIGDTNNFHDLYGYKDLLGKMAEHLPHLDTDHFFAPGFGDMYLSVARKCLHDSALEHPDSNDDTVSVGEGPKRGGIPSRIAALETFARKMENYHEALREHMSPEQSVMAEKYLKVTHRLAEDESKKLQIAIEPFKRPISGFENICYKLAAKIDRTLQSPTLKGDLLRSRNQHVNELMNKLERTAFSCDDADGKVGNPEWERTEGVFLARQAAKDFKEVKTIMNDAGLQVDEHGFGARFKKITRQFDEIKDKAVTGEFQFSLAGLVESMGAFFKGLLSRIGFKMGDLPQAGIEPGAAPGEARPAAARPA